MLLLSWVAVGGGRGIVTLDLLNCTEVRSVPSPTHPSAREDIGTVAALTQSGEADKNNDELGEMALMETLCPFQLLYSDGVERLGAESARERVRWVSAIWCVALHFYLGVHLLMRIQGGFGSLRHDPRSLSSWFTYRVDQNYEIHGRQHRLLGFFQDRIWFRFHRFRFSHGHYSRLFRYAVQLRGQLIISWTLFNVFPPYPRDG